MSFSDRRRRFLFSISSHTNELNTYNFDAKHETHLYRVRLHARHVQDEAPKEEHTHIECVLVNGVCKTAMNRKTHPSPTDFRGQVSI